MVRHFGALHEFEIERDPCDRTILGDLDVVETGRRPQQLIETDDVTRSRAAKGFGGEREARSMPCQCAVCATPDLPSASELASTSSQVRHPIARSGLRFAPDRIARAALPGIGTRSSRRCLPTARK